MVAWRAGFDVGADFVCGEVGRVLLEVTEFAGLGSGQGHCPVSSVGDVGDGGFSMAW